MPRDESVRRTQAGHAAVRRWCADRPGGLAAKRERDDAAADGRSRPARRSTGPPLGVPRISPGALQRSARIAIAAAAGELDHRELRGEHSARLHEARDRGGVLVEDLIAIRRRAPGGRRAFRGKEVLRAVGDAEQRTRVASLDRGVSPTGLGARTHTHDRRDSVVLRTDTFQKIAELVRELDSRDLTLAKRRAQLPTVAKRCPLRVDTPSEARSRSERAACEARPRFSRSPRAPAWRAAPDHSMSLLALRRRLSRLSRFFHGAQRLAC